jgi:hypothetical protein
VLWQDFLKLLFTFEKTVNFCIVGEMLPLQALTCVLRIAYIVLRQPFTHDTIRITHDDKRMGRLTQLMDPKGFYAPFGPATAEQRHPQFAVRYEGHSCQWNGPSWPYATSITLTALANVLNNYKQDVIKKGDYFETLKIYTKSHRLKRENGRVVCWIDENLNPYTGDWIARTRLAPSVRGKDYNHSTYCDLVISGLVGLRPRPDDIVEVNPLVPADTWDWFCLDSVLYHGRLITIVWDKTGEKYNRGKGLRVYADGQEIARAETLGRVASSLPKM